MKHKAETFFFLLISLFFIAGCEQKETSAIINDATIKDEDAAKKKEMDKSVSPIHEDILAIGEEVKRGKIAYDSLRRRLFALPRELSSHDAQALLNILMEPPAETWTMLGWAAIYNDGLNVLRRMKNPPPRFPRQLLNVYEDNSRAHVIRDYSLQHFGSMLVTYYSNPEGRGRLVFPTQAERMEVEEALRKALLPGKGAIMGTACNLADDIMEACVRSGMEPPVTRQEMGEICAKIASSETEELAARISSYGFLSKYKQPVILPISREYMRDKKQPVLLRAAAIHYVARFAEGEDRELLGKLAKDTDLRISFPAREGLKNYDLEESK